MVAISTTYLTWTAVGVNAGLCVETVGSNSVNSFQYDSAECERAVVLIKWAVIANCTSRELEHAEE